MTASGGLLDCEARPVEPRWALAVLGAPARFATRLADLEGPCLLDLCFFATASLAAVFPAAFCEAAFDGADFVVPVFVGVRLVAELFAPVRLADAAVATVLAAGALVVDFFAAGFFGATFFAAAFFATGFFGAAFFAAAFFAAGFFGAAFFVDLAALSPAGFLLAPTFLLTMPLPSSDVAIPRACTYSTRPDHT
jgi:hypothetical protein